MMSIMETEWRARYFKEIADKVYAQRFDLIEKHEHKINPTAYQSACFDEWKCRRSAFHFQRFWSAD